MVLISANGRTCSATSASARLGTNFDDVPSTVFAQLQGRMSLLCIPARAVFELTVEDWARRAATTALATKLSIGVVIGKTWATSPITHHSQAANLTQNWILGVGHRHRRHWSHLSGTLSNTMPRVQDIWTLLGRALLPCRPPKSLFCTHRDHKRHPTNSDSSPTCVFMFFPSRLPSRARTRPRKSIFKEEFDSEQSTSSADGVTPDMTTSPTPRELRRLASDHDFVLAAPHPRRLGLGPFIATHLSLVAAFAAGVILVVVAIVYATTTSNQILECPSWAVDCRQADDWTVEHLGTVQGIVTLVFFVGLSALGYVALAFCESSVWALLTLQPLKIRELEAYLSVTRGSVLAAPVAAMAVKTLPAGLILAVAVVVTIIPLASIPMVGFAFTPTWRSVVLGGNYAAGGGINERDGVGDLPTSVKSIVPSRSLLLAILPSLILAITIGVATWTSRTHKRNAIPVMRLAGLAEMLKSAQTGYLRAHAATDGAKTYLPAGDLGGVEVGFGRDEGAGMAGLGVAVGGFKQGGGDREADGEEVERRVGRREASGENGSVV